MIGKVTRFLTTLSKGERRALKSATVRVELPEGEGIEPLLGKILKILSPGLGEISGIAGQEVAKAIQTDGEYVLIDAGGVKVCVKLAGSGIEIVAFPSEGIRPHRLPKWPPSAQREAEKLSAGIERMLNGA